MTINGCGKVGTNGFMAPEVIKHGSYNNLCDIFSAGVILFAMLTRRLPFREIIKQKTEMDEFDYMFDGQECYDVNYLLLIENRKQFWERLRNSLTDTINIDNHNDSNNNAPKWDRLVKTPDSILYNQQLQDLISDLLSDDPKKRPDFDKLFPNVNNHKHSPSQSRPLPVHTHKSTYSNNKTNDTTVDEEKLQQAPRYPWLHQPYFRKSTDLLSIKILDMIAKQKGIDNNTNILRRYDIVTNYREKKEYPPIVEDNSDVYTFKDYDTVYSNIGKFLHNNLKGKWEVEHDLSNNELICETTIGKKMKISFSIRMFLSKKFGQSWKMIDKSQPVYVVKFIGHKETNTKVTQVNGKLIEQQYVYKDDGKSQDFQNIKNIIVAREGTLSRLFVYYDELQSQSSVEQKQEEATFSARRRHRISMMDDCQHDDSSDFETDARK